MANFSVNLRNPSEEDTRELSVPFDKNFQLALWGGDGSGNYLSLDYDATKLILMSSRNPAVANHAKKYIFTATRSAINQKTIIRGMSGSRQFAMIEVNIDPPAPIPEPSLQAGPEPQWNSAKAPDAWTNNVPAKQMTEDDARQCYGFFRHMGWISSVGNPMPSKGDSGIPADWGDFTRVRIQPSICGVDFRYGANFNATTEVGRKKAIAGFSTVSIPSAIDTRLIVFLVRLTKHLQSTYKTTTIYTNGIITSGRDAHQFGRAFDLLGFDGNVPDGLWDVYNDWGVVGMQFDEKRTDKDGKEHQYLKNFGGFRFTKNPELGKKKPRTPEIVDDLMGLLTREVQDENETSSDKTSRGLDSIGKSSFLIYPDHPTDSLATAHVNHFHCQIGKTR